MTNIVGDMTIKRGRPTKYKTSFCDALIDQMSQGALNEEIFASWSISKDTFYRWINEHEDFKAAYEIGMPLCEAWWIGQ